MKVIGQCHTCGVDQVEYEHEINQRYVKILQDTFGLIGPSVGIEPRAHGHKSDLDRVTYSYAKHFGLTAKVYDDRGRERRGWWQLTPLGWRFLRGYALIPRHVRTFRNETIWESDEKVNVDSVPAWKGWTHSDALASRRLRTPTNK
jgi:hypothetical protein